MSDSPSLQDVRSQALLTLPHCPAATAQMPSFEGVFPSSLTDSPNGPSSVSGEAVPIGGEASIPNGSAEHDASAAELPKQEAMGATSTSSIPVLGGTATPSAGSAIPTALDGSTSHPVQDGKIQITPERNADHDPKTIASDGGAALSADDSGATQAAASLSLQGTGVAGSALTAQSGAGSFTTNTKVGVEPVQQARAANGLSTVGHDGKHKAAVANNNNTAAPFDGDSNNSSPSTPASADLPNSPASNRSDTQAALIADVATPQMHNTVAIQGSPGTPNSPPGASGSQNADNAPVATYSPATATASNPEAANLPSVTSAQLVHAIRHSEMRLGVQSEEFGSMSISTSLGRQVLSAQISTEHFELGRALAVHLPAMEQKLSTTYSVQAKVEVNHGTPSSDTRSGDHPQGGRQQQSGNKGVALPPGPASPVTAANHQAETSAADSSRLDIRI